jgi:hypothetical protein
MTIPLADFDFGALDDPDFKEDSVREEIIAPLLWALGFAVNGPATIKRTKPLEHPYVSIGSAKRKVSIFPDYLLQFDGKVACVVDAKRPREDVMNPDHLSQVYTYAVHRDVKAAHYALCNGRRFVLFRVEDMKNIPTLDFELKDIASRWPEIQERLAPHRLTKPAGNLEKDFGLHLDRIGITSDIDLAFPQVPIFQIGRSEASLFCILATTRMETERYAACFDFDQDVFDQLTRVLPSAFATQLRGSLAKWPSFVNVGTNGNPIAVDISARVSRKLVETKNEIFRPLVITAFSRQ